MRRSVRIAILGASPVGALLLGTSTLLITDSSTWAFRNSWVFWLGFFTTAVVITYFALALLDKRSYLLHVCGGAALVAVLSACFVFGFFLPHALHLGGRTVDDFAENSEFSWQDILAFLLVASVIVGALLGGLTGLFRASIDHAGDRAASISHASESASHLP